MPSEERLAHDLALLSPTHTVEEISRRMRQLAPRERRQDRKRPESRERTVALKAETVKSAGN